MNERSNLSLLYALKLAIKPFLFVAAPLFIFGVTMPGPNGTPMINLGDFIPDKNTLPNLGKSVSNLSLNDIKPGSTPKVQTSTVYKWKDENGKTHFSNTRPAEGAQTIAVKHAENSMAPPPIIDRDKGSTATTSSSSSYGNINSSVNVDQLGTNPAKLVGDAKAVREMMEKRNKQLETGY